MSNQLEYDPPHPLMTIMDLAFEASEYHKKAIEGVKWTVIYCMNAGERLLDIRSRLGPRKFKPWLDKPGNFAGSRTTAYKYIALAEEKEQILSVREIEQIDSVSAAFRLIGRYTQHAITAIQTENPESQADSLPVNDGASMPPSLANEGGDSSAPTEAEQAILNHLLRPEDLADFESGLDLPDEYQCYLCNNWFFADQMKRLHGNRYCYSCREELPEADLETPALPLYETTLFDEPPPEPHILPDANGTLPGSHDQAVTTNAGAVEPPAMAERDPYDEMLILADEIFPLLSSMEAVRTYGIYGPLRRFIELFRQIHQLEQE